MPRRSLTPLVLATLTAVGTIGLLWAALVHGWLGPDVGRGDGFCEAARDALVVQPANTFSNAGFVVAGHVPVVDIWANVAFGLLLVAAVTGEALLWRRGTSGRDPRWGVASVAALGLAFAIWTQARTGSPFCRTHSLVQGHAMWHLLDAVAAYLLYRLYASERPRPHPRMGAEGATVS